MMISHDILGLSIFRQNQWVTRSRSWEYRKVGLMFSLVLFLDVYGR